MARAIVLIKTNPEGPKDVWKELADMDWMIEWAKPVAGDFDIVVETLDAPRADILITDYLPKIRRVPGVMSTCELIEL